MLSYNMYNKLFKHIPICKYLNNIYHYPYITLNNNSIF